MYEKFTQIMQIMQKKGQCLANKCEYHNRLSRLYMPKEEINK